MQLPTQAQFVTDCLIKYWFTEIPDGQKWEAAHFPLPHCSGEDDTVLLWSADHTVQGLLQSVELDHKCFHSKANKKDLFNLTQYYPQYLPLFKQLKSKFTNRYCEKGRGKGGKKAAITNQANGTSIFASGMQSAGGKATNAQRWRCLVTGFIANPGNLARYQKARGIDTKLRVKIN